jgi:hypothetical protein
LLDGWEVRMHVIMSSLPALTGVMKQSAKVNLWWLYCHDVLVSIGDLVLVSDIVAP